MIKYYHLLVRSLLLGITCAISLAPASALFADSLQEANDKAYLDSIHEKERQDRAYKDALIEKQRIDRKIQDDARIRRQIEDDRYKRARDAAQQRR